MNLLEHHENIISIIPNLQFNSTFDGKLDNLTYYAKNLKQLRKYIIQAQTIPFTNDVVDKIKSTWLFSGTDDIGFLSSPEETMIRKLVEELRIKLDLIKIIIEASPIVKEENLLIIKIPELKSLDELIKLSNELKKSIELPITTKEIDGHAEIVGADKGSLVLYLTVGSILAVKLVAAICWSAAVIRKKNAEAKIFEQHAKTLELKNDSLENIISAQQIQLKNILDSEARAIANKHYNHEDPETIERLKLSITTTADLIDRGIKILPNNSNEKVQKSFPDYDKLNVIESTIKQITE